MNKYMTSNNKLNKYMKSNKLNKLNKNNNKFYKKSTFDKKLNNKLHKFHITRRIAAKDDDIEFNNDIEIKHMIKNKIQHNKNINKIKSNKKREDK